MMLSIIQQASNEWKNINLFVDRMENALETIFHKLRFVDGITDRMDVSIAANSERVPHISSTIARRRGGLLLRPVEGTSPGYDDMICVLDANLQYPPEVACWESR